MQAGVERLCNCRRRYAEAWGRAPAPLTCRIVARNFLASAFWLLVGALLPGKRTEQAWQLKPFMLLCSGALLVKELDEARRHVQLWNVSSRQQHPVAITLRSRLRCGYRQPYAGGGPAKPGSNKSTLHLALIEFAKLLLLSFGMLNIERQP